MPLGLGGGQLEVNNGEIPATPGCSSWASMVTAMFTAMDTFYVWSSSCSTREVIWSCHSWTWLSFLVFVSMGHIQNKTQNYAWAKFSWYYFRLAPKPLAVCRSPFVWKWDDLYLKKQVRIQCEIQVISGFHWFSLWDLRLFWTWNSKQNRRCKTRRNTSLHQPKGERKH